MTPYYEHGGITIFYGDCRELLPLVNGELVLTDPPYNVGKNYGTHDDSMTSAAYSSWLINILSLCANTAPEVVYFPGMANLMTTTAVLEKTPLRPVRVLGWHKREFAGDLWTSGPAISWEPIIWASRSEKPRFNKLFGNAGRDFLVVNSIHGNPFKGPHPCPKPLSVMKWLVNMFAPKDSTVIDPFCGTGTTLRACKEAGLSAIGIEIEERYCELTATRLEQSVFDFRERGKDSPTYVQMEGGLV